MFRYLAEQKNVAHKYDVDSAGTSSWHVGERPDPRMRKVAAKFGFKYDGTARQIVPDDLDYFDLLIAMDDNNKDTLLGLAQNSDHKEKIHLLREYDPDGDPNSPVPDPYYGGIDGFENVYKIVKRSCQTLLETLEGEGKK
jgi:protein-tyrosine phosphatase